MKGNIVDILKKLRFLLVPYLVILCFCFVIKALYSKEVIYYTVNSWHFAFGDVIFPLFTDMGDGLFVVAIALVALAYNYRVGFLLATSYSITSLVAQALKRIIRTPRPMAYFHGTGHMYLVKGIPMLNSLSFPSGHTISAFSAAVVLTYITPKKQWGLFYLLIAILIGYSRMYLSEHFFEDVVGGSAIGLFVTVFWVSWIDKKAFIQSPAWDKGLIDTIRGKKV
ncbi:phosphatase PAP2 family protein [uncultured Mucilaginibacter sp.]|uniref:phosphatase PAP2 family protein n=1 Tax=uncultured Mucilaginibacter sp. TaxID=797541 RepID=UPI0025FF8A49|nr:phosphatase PAP2 family protein [uncultured Mucilaginibacter sp.]